LVKRFGAPGLQLWLEILAITDKTENVLKVDNYWLANVSKLVCSRVAKSLQVLNNCIAKGWLVPNKPFESGLEITYSVAKYTEYHRTHSPNSTTLGRENKIIGVPPNLPSPSLTKQKKERPPISPRVGDEVEPITVEEVRSLVDEIPGVKPTKALTGGCLRSVKTRIAEHPDKTFWVGYCAEIRDSDFLCGRKNDFQASLAWLCLPNNMSKVLSGFYASRTGPTAMPPKKGFISKGDKAMDSGMRVLAKLKEQEAIHGTIGNREASNLIG